MTNDNENKNFEILNLIFEKKIPIEKVINHLQKNIHQLSSDYNNQSENNSSIVIFLVL
jgi:hypothetical protein